jgi:hypothetical protein
MTDAATKRHNSALRWKNLWAALVFLLGIAVVVFLALALALLVHGSFLEGAISGFGSLLSGGGFAWVRSRWEDAKKDEQETFHELNEAQKAIKMENRAVSSREALLGKK